VKQKRSGQPFVYRYTNIAIQSTLNPSNPELQFFGSKDMDSVALDVRDAMAMQKDRHWARGLTLRRVTVEGCLSSSLGEICYELMATE